METVITRDTDVLREYLAALDERERGFSPFGKLAATVKLARLRSELDAVPVEATDDDLSALRREIDERLHRTFTRRFLARRWGARVAVLLAIVFGQQFALALVLLANAAFVRFAPTPARWNPVLPHEQPPFLWVFIFLFFFATPMLALQVLFGGRFFRSWRKTFALTVVFFALSILGTFLVLRTRETNNPVRHSSSFSQLAAEYDISLKSYDEWKQASWLINDPKLRRDYEAYFRNGPGRLITSRFDASNDFVWRDSLPVMKEYLDGREDPEGFREWLAYYLDRNRVFSEERAEREVNAITGNAVDRYLGLWQLEPLLKERDRRLYRAYLGSIDQAMLRWGIAWLALITLAFLVLYFAEPALGMWERVSRRTRRRASGESIAVEAEYRESKTGQRLLSRSGSFPERSDIETPPFFDTPFQLLRRVHLSFMRLIVLTAMLVFAFWVVSYGIDLATPNPNPRSQVELMRSHLLGLGLSRESDDAFVRSASLSLGGVPMNSELADAGSEDEQTLARVRELEGAFEEGDYQTGKRFEEQYRLYRTQRSELRRLTSQFEETTSTLPEQISQVESLANAAEARAGLVISEATAAKITAEGVEKQIGTKLGEVESRTARAAELVGKLEEQASMLATRTETLEKELDRRARQIEARTEELGERTAGLKEREERFERLQRAALEAILLDLKARVDELDRRVGAGFSRRFSQEDARRESESLRQRISVLARELRELNTEQAKRMITQLDELTRRLDEAATLIK